MNTKPDQSRPHTRMIHIRLPEQLHKKLRVRAAESDITIQDWVVDAIEAQLKRNRKDKPDLEAGVKD